MKKYYLSFFIVKNYNRQILTTFVDMENNVTKYHLATLVTLRRLFEKIKDEKYMDIDLIIQYLLVLRVLKKKVSDYYMEIISSFKDEKNIQKLYDVFRYNILVII